MFSSILAFTLAKKLSTSIDVLFDYLKDKYTKGIYYTTEIDLEENPRLKFAFYQELKSHCLSDSSSSYLKIEDEFDTVSYTLADGEYTVEYKDVEIYFTLTKGKLIIQTHKVSIYGRNLLTYKEFKGYIESVYKTYNSPEKVTLYYLSKNDSWTIPIFRKPRDIKTLTASMKQVFIQIERFKSNKNDYELEAQPYRYGCFLFGKPRTGKSLMVEYIAQKYGMTVYLVNLNSKGMTDATLIALTSKIPSNSIICFDEIDKQIKTLRENKMLQVSFGGLLTAIDGPQRLSEGTIVIMTANRDDFLEFEEWKLLVRKGRIDKVFHL